MAIDASRARFDSWQESHGTLYGPSGEAVSCVGRQIGAAAGLGPPEVSRSAEWNRAGRAPRCIQICRFTSSSLIRVRRVWYTAKQRHLPREYPT